MCEEGTKNNLVQVLHTGGNLSSGFSASCGLLESIKKASFHQLISMACF